MWVVAGLVSLCLLTLACSGSDPEGACRSTAGDPYLGQIPADGECELCSSNAECVEVYGSTLDEGCTAICKDRGCEKYCAGDCPAWFDAGACTVGDGSCPAARNGPHVCDPVCGSAGGCRHCAYDEQCEQEIGPGAICVIHCGTCCRPGDNGSDGGFPCNCI